MSDIKSESVILAEEILKNIELSEISLSSIVLKCSRLARITNNQNAMNLFHYEMAGYPKDGQGFILADAFNLARNVNRTYFQTSKEGVVGEYMFSETVAEIEAEIETAKSQMLVAFDRDVSVTSANPMQYVFSPVGNSFERARLSQLIADKTKKLNQLRVGYYNYVSGVLYELVAGNISENIFNKRKLLVDKNLSQNLPETLKKFVSAYSNLQSKNDEDWANAVHTCRRVIKDVADFLFPPSLEKIIIQEKELSLDDEHYILRLKEYIKKKNKSKKFRQIVGSNLNYISDRLDSIYQASNKGTHDKVTQEEAERYVIYSYLILGDILTL